MRVPVRLPVAGFAIRIEYVEKILDEDGQSIWGETVCGANLIRVSTSKPTDESQVWATLYHELNHVAWDISGINNVVDDKIEEALAHSVDNLLGPILALRPDIRGAKYRDVEFEFEED